jgi:hypothetical protein
MVQYSCHFRLLAFVAALSGTVARAEIILDDFTDSAVVVSPASANGWVSTNNVGPFAAGRQIRIGWGQGDPEGQLDANISIPSVLTGTVPHLNPRNVFSEPIVALQFEYTLNGANFTEGGMNDTLFLDFRRMESAIPPSFLLVQVNGLFFSQFSLPRSNAPFSITIPSDRFAGRDGMPGVPDYANARSIGFEIRASGYTGGGPDPLNFVMELDRVRVGPSVPESCCLSLVVSYCVVNSIMFRRRRRSPLLLAKPGAYDAKTLRLFSLGCIGHGSFGHRANSLFQG